jgi:hypothetical protein
MEFSVEKFLKNHFSKKFHRIFLGKWFSAEKMYEKLAAGYKFIRKLLGRGVDPQRHVYTDNAFLSHDAAFHSPDWSRGVARRELIVRANGSIYVHKLIFVSHLCHTTAHNQIWTDPNFVSPGIAQKELIDRVNGSIYVHKQLFLRRSVSCDAV